MTTITINSNAIAVSGHTGYADIGSDIVCAGVSSITCALMEWVRKNRSRTKKADIECEKGHVRIFFGDRHEWEDARDLAVTGYSLIAAAYPEHVKIVYDKQGE